MSDTSVTDQGAPQLDAGENTAPPSSPPSASSPAQRTWQPPPGLPGPLQALVAQLGQAMKGNPAGPLQKPPVVPPLDQMQQRSIERAAPYDRPSGAYPPWKPSPVQTYLPAMPTRSAHEWGSPAEYPNTPATWELRGIWQGVGNKFAQIGSGDVKPIAEMLGPLGGSLMSAYTSGQSERVKFEHERAVDAAWELDRRQHDELLETRDMFALFGGDVATMTGADENVQLPDVGNLHDAWFTIANKHHDQYILSALNSGAGGLKRAENIMKERDAAARDLRASLIQQEKDEARRREEAPFRIDGGASQAGPPIGHTDPAPGLVPTGALPTDNSPDPNAETPEGTTPATPKDDGAKPGEETGSTPDNDISPYGPAASAQAARPQGVQLAQAGASDAPQPGMQRLAQAQEQPPPQQQQQETPAQQEARAAGWRPDMLDAAAIQAVNDPMFVPNAKGAFKGYPAAETGYILRRADEIHRQLDRIKGSKLQGAQAEAAIRAVDPVLADTLKQYVQGNLPVPQNARFASLASGYILPLGKMMDPTFNENNFKLRYQTKKDFTSGVEGRTLTSIATSKYHLEHALAAMDHVPNMLWSQIGDWRSLDMIVPKDVQEAMGILHNSIHTGSNEFERALLGGKPPRGSVTETEADLDWKHKSPEYIKATLRDKITALKVRLDVLKGQFRAGFGRGDDDMYKIFDNWAASGKDSLDSGDPERTTAAPGQINDLKDLDRRQPGAQAAPPKPIAPGYKFEPVQ